MIHSARQNCVLYKDRCERAVYSVTLLVDCIILRPAGVSEMVHATVHIYLEVFNMFIETILLFLLKKKKICREIEIIRALL